MPEQPPTSSLALEAERAVRRGDLKEALALFRRLLSFEPDSAALRARIAAVESLVQPRELSAGRPAQPPPGSLSFERPPTPEQVAEALFDRGDIAGAEATYERILKARPGHQLAHERLLEIRAAAAAQPDRTPPAPALPRDKDRLFEELLARIASRRRP